MGQYDMVSFDGKRITRRQRQAVQHVSKITADRYSLAMHCYQGSKMPRTDWSGTTHMGLGVADFYVYGMSTMRDNQLQEITRLLRREGCQAAFLRGPPDGMPWHWHCCDLDTHGMDQEWATTQVSEYRKGNNGLEYGAEDRYPYRPRPIRKWDFKT